MSLLNKQYKCIAVIISAMIILGGCSVGAHLNLQIDDTDKNSGKTTYQSPDAVQESSVYRVNDEVNDITWYFADGTPDTIEDFTFFAFLGRADEHYRLRLETGIKSEDWVSFVKIDIDVDGEVYPILFNHYRDKTTDSVGGNYEWIDVTVDHNLKDLLNRIAASEESVIYYIGNASEAHYSITDDQKTIAAYLGLLQQLRYPGYARVVPL